MVRGGIAIVAALALGACKDAPARPAPRPTAPLQASRALIAQAMTQAAADAEQARRMAPPPPPPTIVDDDAVAGVLGMLDTDDLQGAGGLGTRGFGPSDPDGDPGDVLLVPDAPDDPDDDPDGVFGGPRTPPGDPRVVLQSDADGIDPDLIEQQRMSLHVLATMCQRRATRTGTLDDDTRVTVSVAKTTGGASSVHVNGSGPLASCMNDFVRAPLPAGTTLTFQITIPAS